VKVGDRVKVKVIAIDDQDRVKLSRKVLMQGEGDGAPAGDRPPREDRGERGDRGERRDRGGDRGPRRERAGGD